MFGSRGKRLIQSYHFQDDVEPDLPPSNLDPGILPTEIRKLVESRREVKKLMKASNLSPELRMQVHIIVFFFW